MPILGQPCKVPVTLSKAGRGHSVEYAAERAQQRRTSQGTWETHLPRLYSGHRILQDLTLGRVLGIFLFL